MDINLADYMTLREAASALHKSDKQIRRYITGDKNKHIAPKLNAIMLGKQYFITRASVQALLDKPVQVEDSLSRRVGVLEVKEASHKEEMTSQLAMMSREFEQRLDDMARHLAKLTDEVNELKTSLSALQTSYTLDKMPRQNEIITQESASAEEDNSIIWVKSLAELPVDALSLFLFADEQRINRRTLRDFVVKHQLPHYARSNPTRPREAERFVTKQQQTEILRARGKY